MKMRNKGKVHPSPSSSSSSSSSSPHLSKDVSSILKLLPAAILVLASVLSPEDREVLAYMVTRSIKSPNPSTFVPEKKKKAAKNPSVHKPPRFDCDCFDCYTTYWVKWDSSPNRQLIHQAIEAFEEHLNAGESLRKPKTNRRLRMRRCRTVVQAEETPEVEEIPQEGKSEAKENGVVVEERENESPEIGEATGDCVARLPIEVVCSPGNAESAWEEVGSAVEEEVASPSPSRGMEESVSGTAASSHSKGLARKVFPFPDVLGFLNSRLWSLWGPNA